MMNYYIYYKVERQDGLLEGKFKKKYSTIQRYMFLILRFPIKYYFLHHRLYLL